VTITLFNTHKSTLDNALKAINDRGYWSAYPEIPSGKVYGETARADGEAAFKRYLNTTIALDQPGSGGTVGSEQSPFGFDLGITYPRSDVNALIEAATKAQQQWKKSSIEVRVGICLEILHRLNSRSFELAFAVMHTTGQGFMMAFQAGGPHAQDRGLEAVAYAFQAMTQTPRESTWTKRVSRDDSVTLNKTFHILPRGIAAVIGCSTFPTWNSYPGLFASLATGNAVIVKPHPGAILPLAITVKIAREVLSKNGFDPNVVTLAVDDATSPITKELVTNPAVGIIDYTGSSAFGDWIEDNARQAVIFTEKAGVNPAVIDSTDNLRAMTGNLAFSLSLYSGQMCTTTQNIFIPAGGIETDQGHKSFDETAGAIVKALDWLLSDAARGAEILGAIQNENTARRIGAVKKDGGVVLRESAPVTNEHFPKARVHSPMVLKVTAGDEKLYMRETFGPIVYIIETKDTDEAIALAARCAREQGAITAAVYSTDQNVLASAEEALIDAGAPVSCNLTGQIYVNQSAAFSDYHVSGANPSGNATLCDLAYVTPRFRFVQSRVPVPTAQPVPA
jgi:phenylacetic acid degradation protein paaN